jgi:hypothetical protein
MPHYLLFLIRTRNSRRKKIWYKSVLLLNWIVSSFKPGAHTAILVGRFRFRWMFSAKTISDRICGLIYIATFANIIHLNLNRPTKIAVCAPGFSLLCFANTPNFPFLDLAPVHFNYSKQSS